MKNAPATFQRINNRSLGRMEAGKTTLVRLRRGLTKFAEVNLTAKSEFGHFVYVEVTFLGQVVGNGRVKSQSTKMQSINH